MEKKNLYMLILGPLNHNQKAIEFVVDACKRFFFIFQMEKHFWPALPS